jgi:hypothetical protein
MFFLKVLIFSLFAMKDESQINIQPNITKNVEMERSLDDNLRRPLKGSSKDILADVEESKSEKERRIERLSQLKKTCCLGSCMIGYNKLMSCFWHVTEPCLETVGMLSLGTSAILTVMIPVISDPTLKNYFAIGSVVTFSFGEILLKTGSKFAKDLETRHEENVLALLQDEH